MASVVEVAGRRFSGFELLLFAEEITSDGMVSSSSNKLQTAAKQQ